MRHFRTLTMALAIGLACTQLTAQKVVSAEVTQANDRWEAFFNNGDAAGIASLYTEDGTLLPPNHDVVMGRDQIAAFWGGVVAPGVTVELTTVVAMAKGKMAIEEGRARVLANGNVVDEAKYMLEWKKVNGDWQIHRDIWSSNNPLPED